MRAEVSEQERSIGFASVARWLSAAVAAGLIAGAVIGGVGGRIAMFVLRLTSDPNLRGLQTDDDFTIGIVSSATLFLIGLTAFGGVAGGVVYLAIRSWLPERARPWLFGALSGVVGGAAVIRPGGIDFTRLEPLALAVVMFIALPAVYGVATSLLAERFLRDESAFQRSRASFGLLVFLLPIALFGARSLPVLVAIIVGLVLGYPGPRLRAIASATAVTWLGRAGLAAIGVAASLELARDVSAVL